MHDGAAVLEQLLLAGVDVLVGCTSLVDRCLAVFQPVSHRACLDNHDRVKLFRDMYIYVYSNTVLVIPHLDTLTGIVRALTKRAVTLVRRRFSKSFLKELSRAHVLVTAVLLVLHQGQLAVRPLLLRQEVPHRVLLELQHGHERRETSQVGTCCR